MLSSPDSDLIAKLGEKQAKIVKAGTTDFKKGNGTGPYKLTSFQPGVRSTHVRNENYWRDGPNIDGWKSLRSPTRSSCECTHRR